jgi:hypothetical protein
MRLWLRAAGAERQYAPATLIRRFRPAAQLHRYARTVMYSLVLTIIAWLVAIAFLRSSIVVAQSAEETLKQRPVNLPTLEPGDSCPITTGSRGTVPIQRHIFGGALWFGKGPVYFALAWKASPGDDATFALEPVPREGNAHRAKTPWVAVPSYSGPILIRGLALDASRRALLFDATGAGPRNGLELQAPQAPAPSLWSFWASSMWVPGPGCYGVQIDTLGATDVVVFEAQ